MQKTLLVLPILLLSICLHAQTKIEGNFQSMEGFASEIYLLAITRHTDLFASTNKYMVDTAVVDENGKFKFELAALPCTDCLYRIDVRPADANGPIIFAGTSKENFALFELKENQYLKIAGEASQLTKSFSVDTEADTWSYEAIRQIREPVYQFTDQLYAQFSNPESLKGKNVDSLREAGIQQLTLILEENNKSLLSLMESSSNVYDKLVGCALYDYDMKMENDLPVYEAMSHQLKEDYQEHPFYVQVNERIYDTKYVLPNGSKAPSLNLPDPDGNNIALDEVDGNLILIDFWASWCSPCRHENRVTVKPLYDAFKDKGFAVYSVSVDNKKEKWTAAIERDEMTWVNVSDLQGRKSPVYSTYKIDALPTTYLVEKEGFKILAKNIRGEELKDFVAKYYSDKADE